MLGILSLLGLSLGLSLGMASTASAQLAIPHQALGVQLDDLVDEAVFVLDINSLPARPRFIAEVTPGPTHPDIELEVEIARCDIPSQNPSTPCPSGRVSDPAVGANSVTYNVYSCSPYGNWQGRTCDVEVRVLDFGSGGAPASVDVLIRSETQVPTATRQIEVDLTPQPTSISFDRDRDTTIYEEAADGSNGQGDYIWAGTAVDFQFPNFERDERRGLITFDVGGLGGPIPPGATIDDAELILYSAGTLGLPVDVSVTPVADAGGFVFSSWFSGDAHASGNEFLPGFGMLQAATWASRSHPFGTWATPGGSPDGAPVATTTVFGPGPVSFQSPALTAVIEDMWLTGNDRNGLLLRDATPDIALGSRGAQLVSGENSDPLIRPELIVDYTPATADPQSGTINSGTLQFIGEGSDFRWVYDDDHDDILFTEIGGRCEITSNLPNPLSVPYEYSFDGSPSYEGLDCCTWQIDSQQTSTTGTGQAIFFLNLDSSDPANFPGDLDDDGILDLCDNCPYVPNGPALGTCLGGSDAGSACRSDQECNGGSCSLAQEVTGVCVGGSNDGQVCQAFYDCPESSVCDRTDGATGEKLAGDACPVPEPGTGSLILVGVLGLGGLASHRQRRRRSE